MTWAGALVKLALLAATLAALVVLYSHVVSHPNPDLPPASSVSRAPGP